jgi:hypothetical protein
VIREADVQTDIAKRNKGTVRDRRGAISLFGVLVAGVLLLGCGGVKPGSAGDIAPESSPNAAGPGATGGDSGSTGSAPRVREPLDPTRLLVNACDALSPAHVDALDLEPGKPRTNEVGPTCSWDYADGSRNTVSVAPIEPNKNGLSDLYGARDEQAYFEETTIAGYPAIYSDITDDRHRGRCTLFVGVTDQLAVFILTQLDKGADVSNPCPVADKVGAAMIETLREG